MSDRPSHRQREQRKPEKTVEYEEKVQLEPTYRYEVRGSSEIPSVIPRDFYLGQIVLSSMGRLKVVEVAWKNDHEARVLFTRMPKE
jgi:hypothetical protein